MDKDFVINQLNSTKLPELKQLAKLMEVKHTGRKLELKERLLEQLNSKKGLKKAQEYFMKTHPLPTTLNAAAESEIADNGAKLHTPNENDQLLTEQAQEKHLNSPEVFKGPHEFYKVVFTSGYMTLEISGKNKEWIIEAHKQLKIFFETHGREYCRMNTCPGVILANPPPAVDILTKPAQPVQSSRWDRKKEHRFLFDVVLDGGFIRLEGISPEWVKAARYYLCGYFQHVKEVKHLPA